MGERWRFVGVFRGVAISGVVGSAAAWCIASVAGCVYASL